MTAARLGECVAVSESTVVRFAKDMGFEGYPDFRKALQEVVRTRLTTVGRIEVSDSLIGEGDVLTKVLNADMEKLRHTLDGINRDAFRRAVERLVQARKIYVMGVRSSSYLAGFLAHHLRMVTDHVRLVQTTSRSDMFEEIMSIEENDVMIVITFPRYSKSIINAADYAHSAGADVIAITDSDASPVAQKADQLLLAQSDMASFIDSLVAPLSIINALLVAVARMKKDDLVVRLRRLEDIWEEYDVYAKNPR